MDEARFQTLLEEATVDCYDEEEEFAGVLGALEDHLHFPLQAEIVGVRVEVLGLDNAQSGLRRGFLAEVGIGDRRYTVGLADLCFVVLDPESAEWLAMVRRWITQ